MNTSFAKLKTQKMDLMQVHNLIDVNTHLETLRAWREQDKIKYLGITHYSTGVYTQLIQFIKSENPDFVQFNCTIPGTSKVKHLEDNLGSGIGKIPDEKRKSKMIEYFKYI